MLRCFLNNPLLIIAVFVIPHPVAPSLRAQTTYGSIVGAARDASGAIVPGVKVTVVNDSTNLSFYAETNDLGAYSFTTLPPGPYTLRAEAGGFRQVDITGIQLQVNQTIRHDLKMQIGQVTETVEVNASLATLATDTSDVGQVINNKEIVELPLNGRQYLQLASLTNGVVTSGSAGGDNAGPNFTSQGNRASNNSYLVGGIDTRIQRNNTYGLSISVDAIGEFKILQNAFAAEYGRGASVVTSTIRSGTNQFHGTLFEFVRNQIFDARYSYNFTNTKTPLRQNQFGFSFGGPIIKNKTFFFTNYEGERIRQTNTGYGQMPLPEYFTGNLSKMTQKAKDPDTGVLFPNNQIPASRITQFSKAGQKYFRAPNGSPLPAYNYTGLTGTKRNGDQGTIKVDHNLSDKIRLDGFATFMERRDETPALNEYNGTISTMKSRPVWGVQYTHIFSPTLLNNFRVGRFITNMYNGQNATTQNNVAVEEFGLKNVRPEEFAYGPPGMAINLFQRAGVPDWQPTGAEDWNLQFNDQLTMTRGRHTFKMGADMRWLSWYDLGWAIQNGTYTFNGQYSTNPFADYLLGLPSYSQVALRGDGKYSYTLKQGEFSYYAQDDWKVNPELTLNYGLRYELVQFPLEVDDALSNWDFPNHTMLFAGKDLPRRLLPTDKNNFSPRLGAAYNPRWSPKTVFRGGWAMMYGNFRQYEAALQHFHPPYVNENFIYNDSPRYSYTISNLWPAPITDFKNGDLSGTTVNYLNDKAMPLSFQWNFNIQRELPGNFLLQLGYVGNSGRDMQVRYDANQAVPMDPNKPTSINDRRPWKKLGFVSANSSKGISSYHGFDARLERRYSNGLSIMGTYTFMKQMGIRGVDNYTVMMIDDIQHSYGPEGNQHRSVISFVYDMPFGRGKRFANNLHPALNLFIGGWQTNGILTFRSGGFLSADSSVNNGAGGRQQNRADATGQAANLPTDQRTTGRWFNTAAFIDPWYTRFGTSGVGVILGPGASNWDLSIFKNTRITEGINLQFRTEMFNAFNHVNLNNPAVNVSNRSTFGTITGAAAARIIQLGLKLV
ncbi:MAG: TonB-dependent receptor, partial [Bryobacterales bacterium]|nr:TonB-dependent receptor [Bryobacterales bacterium]